MIMTVKKMGIKRMYFNVIRTIYGNHTAKMIFNNKKLKGFWSR